MKGILVFILLAFFSIAFNKRLNCTDAATVIAQGHIPSLAMDSRHQLHLVYGKGDSILYSCYVNGGKTFAAPMLVGILPKLYSFAMRGPQIATSGNHITIIACTKEGNIYAYAKTPKDKWVKAARVNDTDTTAKEGLMALGSNGKNYLYTVWLDIRKGGHNNIYGARSIDYGKTWTKNKLLYASPDGHTCECCKPSIAIEGKHISVMFRNWVNGNRDLYLVESFDGGETFGAAQKLGNGSWPLNGCPMDGGGVILNKDVAQTVWQRKGVIYICQPGMQENEIGKGRGCTIAGTPSGNAYAWVEGENVICLLPNHEKKIIGQGSLPVLKAVDNHTVICVWQQKDNINKAIVSW